MKKMMKLYLFIALMVAPNRMQSAASFEDSPEDIAARARQELRRADEELRVARRAQRAAGEGQPVVEQEEIRETDPDMQAAIAASLEPQPSVRAEHEERKEFQAMQEEKKERVEQFRMHDDPELQRLYELPVDVIAHIEQLGQHVFPSTDVPITEQILRSDREDFIGHGDKIQAIAISSDGQLIITGSEDGRIGIWDANSGSVRRVLVAPRITTLALTSDNRFIVAGSQDGVVRVWDANSGQQRYVLAEHTQQISSVVISSDNRRIVSGAHDGTACIWDADRGELLHRLEVGAQTIIAVAMSSNNRFVVTAAYDSPALIWDADRGTLLHRLEGHRGSIRSMAISPDNRFVVTGSHDGTARMWDLQSGELLRILDGRAGSVYSVAVSHNARFIVTGADNGTVRIWDATNGNVVHVLDARDGNKVDLITISRNNKFIITGSEDGGRAYIWDVSSGELLHTLKGHRGISAIAISPDNMFAVTGAYNGIVVVWRGGESPSLFITANFFIKYAEILRSRANKIPGFPQGNLRIMTNGIALLKSVTAKTELKSMELIYQRIVDAFNEGKSVVMGTQAADLGFGGFY